MDINDIIYQISSFLSNKDIYSSTLTLSKQWYRINHQYSLKPEINDNEALRSACRQGHIPIIRCLLEYPRVDPKYVLVKRLTNHQYIMFEDRDYPVREDSMLELLRSPKITSLTGSNSYMLDRVLQYPHVVELMMKKGFNVSAHRCRALRQCIRYGYLDTMKILMQHKGYNINVMRGQIISNAHDPTIIRMLISNPKLDHQVTRQVAIRKACIYLSIDEIKGLLATDGVQMDWSVLYKCLHRNDVLLYLLSLPDAKVNSDLVAKYISEDGYSTDVLGMLLARPDIDPTHNEYLAYTYVRSRRQASLILQHPLTDYIFLCKTTKYLGVTLLLELLSIEIVASTHYRFYVYQKLLLSRNNIFHLGQIFNSIGPDDCSTVIKRFIKHITKYEDWYKYQLDWYYDLIDKMVTHIGYNMCKW